VSTAPGWYQDPAEPTTQRWWDGEGWVGEPVPADATPPETPPDAPPPAATPVTPADTDRPDGHEPILGVPPSGAAPARSTATRSPALPYHRPPDQPPPRPHGLPLATLGARFVARMIDILLVFLLNVAVNGWFVYQYWTEIQPVITEVMRRVLAGESAADLPAPGDRAGTLQIVILIIATALWFAYEVPAVSNSGQTPGKRLMHIRVVRLEQASERRAGSTEQPAHQLGFGRSFRRWNTMGLPTLLWFCVGIGFLFQVVDALFAVFDRPLRQALHDKSALTAVVSVSPEHPGQPEHPETSEEEATDAPADPS
jgi:uncharacterized RDD family membrane protein YckC